MKVAVVDDSKEDAQQLTEYLEKYEAEHDLSIQIDVFLASFGYYNFSSKLEKAFRFFKIRNTHEIMFSNREGVRKISTAEIYYIEKDRDDLVFHTRQGSFRERGSIKTMKEKLEDLPFVECNSGCLVNLRYVKHVGKDTISLTETVELPLSRLFFGNYQYQVPRFKAPDSGAGEDGGCQGAFRISSGSTAGGIDL